MKSNRLLLSIVLAITVCVTVTSESEACGWLRHCHRCRSASSSSSSSAASQNQQGAQQFITIDATSLLLKALERGVGGQTTDLSAGRLQEISDRLDNLVRIVEQVQRNTEAIESLKVGQEAIANRVNNEFVTKADLDKVIDTKLSATIDKRVDDRIEAQFNVFHQRQSAMIMRLHAANSLDADMQLRSKMSPFVNPFKAGDDANNNARIAAPEWEAHSLMKYVDKARDKDLPRLEVENEQGVKGFVTPQDLEAITFE